MLSLLKFRPTGERQETLMKIGQGLLFVLILAKTWVELFMPIPRYTYKTATYIDEVDDALHYRSSCLLDVLGFSANLCN